MLPLLPAPWPMQFSTAYSLFLRSLTFTRARAHAPCAAREPLANSSEAAITFLFLQLRILVLAFLLILIKCENFPKESDVLGRHTELKTELFVREESRRGL